MRRSNPMKIAKKPSNVALGHHSTDKMFICFTFNRLRNRLSNGTRYSGQRHHRVNEMTSNNDF